MPDKEEDGDLDALVASLLGKAEAALTKVDNKDPGDIGIMDEDDDDEEEERTPKIKPGLPLPPPAAPASHPIEKAPENAAPAPEQVKQASQAEASHVVPTTVATQAAPPATTHAQAATPAQVQAETKSQPIQTPAQPQAIQASPEPASPAQAQVQATASATHVQEAGKADAEEKTREKPKEREKNPFDELSQIDLYNKMDEHRDNIWSEKNKIHQTIEQIKSLRVQLTREKERRDELNRLVQDVIIEAKKHQSTRDSVNQEITKIKGEKNAKVSELKKEAEKVSAVKQERDKLNELARGTIGTITHQMYSSLKSLFTVDLSLKNEIILFEMIFELKDKLEIKKKADTTHQAIQQQYRALKDVEGEANQVFERMKEKVFASQQEHDLAITLFRQKDEVRLRADEAHRAVKKILKDIKTLEGVVKTCNDNIERYKKELDMMNDSMRGRKNFLRSREKVNKLKEAKKKAMSSGKLGLDELSLLLEQGELKFK